jgi:ferredoxin
MDRGGATGHTNIEHNNTERSGWEPELGGTLRQNAVYVDETTCIGCGHCAYVARNTFAMEPSYGRARAISQDGDSEELVQEAIDTCPVDCIAWVSFTELRELEAARRFQVITDLGIAGDRSSRARRSRSHRGHA